MIIVRKFVLNILTVIIVGCLCICGFTWVDIHNLKRVDFSLPAEKHIVVIGPSTSANAIDDTKFTSLKNMSRIATELTAIVSILPRVLEQNMQIDTVLIHHDRFEYLYGANGKPKLFGRHLFFRERIPFYFYDPTIIYWGHMLRNVDFYASILNPDCYRIFSNWKTMDDWGFGYYGDDKCVLHDENEEWSDFWYDSAYLEKYGTNVYTKEWIEENCIPTDYAARKAIEICKEHNVVPVLFFTPLYQYDRWCTWEGYCDYVKSYYDNDILVADYEDFQFPDDSYYRDVHHLNSKGAAYFSEYLSKNGIKKYTMDEWLKLKGF